VDESLECMRRCDRLIAAAEGDASLQAFWHEVKREYQADVPRQTESAARTRLIPLGKGPDIPLGSRPVIVGRDPWCDAQLNSDRVSRIHCCLTENDGEVVVLDLGSVNGTRINGRPVELGWLGPGDELSIAHLRYRVANSRAKRSSSLTNWNKWINPEPSGPRSPAVFHWLPERSRRNRRSTREIRG
jgi:hypothetical protein